MATTTKTLTPTNQTITLPDMTERPNASILVDGIGKDADAINALSDQMTTLTATLLTGVITLKKVSNVVFVGIKGAITPDSNGVFATLPEAYRPNIDVYSFITTSGSDANVYLIEIDDSTGNLKVYNRGATITYAYGHFCYVVNG